LRARDRWAVLGTDTRFLPRARVRSPMALRIRATAETAFVASGLAVILVFWVAEFLSAAAEAAEGHVHGAAGDLATRLNVVLFSIGFALLGVVYERHTELLANGTLTLRYAAGYLILIDGVLHAFAFNDHLTQPGPASMFAVVAPLQIVVGLALPRMRAEWDVAWLGLTVVLVALYVATRTTVVWPLNAVEAVEGLGILSKAVEAVTFLVLVQLLRASRTKTTAGVPTAPAKS